jgi:teichuronic acid biosynthesis glycosyltransferase TuaC
VLHVLHVSQQFPCEAYPALGVMVQHSVRSLAPLCEQSVLAPRPYTLPLPGFPYGQLALLPERRIESGYLVHRPRYLYPVPKSLLYPHAGSAMALSVSRYAAHLERPDVIHAHWSYPDGAAASVLRERFRSALVVHARGTLERVIAEQSPRYRAMIGRPLQAADAVVANSEALYEDCLRLGVKPAQLTVIPNGVDTECFKPRDKAESKRALGLSVELMLILFCGYLREVKGVDLLAQVISPLCAARPKLDVALVGSGELEGRLRRELGPLIKARRVLMPGALPQPQVAGYMQAADLLVLPSRSEARGNVILEALACGTPVAAADVGGIPELMRPSHGRLFAPGCTQTLMRTLLALSDDPAQLQQLGAAASIFVEQSGLSWQAHGTALHALYQRLL